MCRLTRGVTDCSKLRQETDYLSIRIGESVLSYDMKESITLTFADRITPLGECACVHVCMCACVSVGVVRVCVYKIVIAG